MSPFGALFVPEQLMEAVSDDAWGAAMLDAARALAAAGSLAGAAEALVDRALECHTREMLAA